MANARGRLDDWATASLQARHHSRLAGRSAPSADLGTALYVYQNNVNRTVSEADISFQQSSDFGASWSNAKTISTMASGAPAPQDHWTSADISTAPWNPNEGFFTCGCFIGDYSGIAASTQVVYPIWTDGRNSPGRPNGDTDIFTNVELGGFH